MEKISATQMRRIAETAAYGLVVRCVCKNRADASVAYKRAPYKHIVEKYYRFLTEQGSFDAIVSLLENQSIVESNRKFQLLGYDRYTWQELVTIIINGAKIDLLQRAARIAKMQEAFFNAGFDAVMGAAESPPKKERGKKG